MDPEKENEMRLLFKISTRKKLKKKEGAERRTKIKKVKRNGARRK